MGAPVIIKKNKKNKKFRDYTEENAVDREREF